MGDVADAATAREAEAGRGKHKKHKEKRKEKHKEKHKEKRRHRQRRTEEEERGGPGTAPARVHRGLVIVDDEEEEEQEAQQRRRRRRQEDQGLEGRWVERGQKGGGGFVESSEEEEEDEEDRPTVVNAGSHVQVAAEDSGGTSLGQWTVVGQEEMVGNASRMRRKRPRSSSSSTNSSAGGGSNRESDSDAEVARRPRRDSDSSGARASASDDDRRDTADESSSDDDASPVRRRRTRHDSDSDEDTDEAERVGNQHRDTTAKGHYAGLVSAEEFKRRAEELRKEKEQRLDAAAVDDGRNAQTVYRDSKGRPLDTRPDGSRQRLSKREVAARIAEEQYEWGKGKVQREESAAREREMELVKSEPFARTEDNPRLERERRDAVREGDPMAKYLGLEDPGAVAAVASGAPSNAPSTTATAASGKPVYRGPGVKPNRYGILPGYRWDGVDRGNGFEDKIMDRKRDAHVEDDAGNAWSDDSDV